MTSDRADCNLTKVRARHAAWRVGSLLLVALIASAAVRAAGAAPTGDRIVVVGDVHGDIENFRAILGAAGLVDSAGRWSGGTATLVQTGDLVERGSRVREVLDLVMRLEGEAREAGGRVVAMLGNHEVYNLLAHLDYTSTPPEVYAEIFAGFTDESSLERRKRAAKQWLRWRRRYPECGAQSKEEWEAGHPLGFVEYFEALGPDGAYGRWLRTLPVLVRVGPTMFSHAGPSPALAELDLHSIYAVNQVVTREVEGFDEARRFLVKRNIILPFFTLAEIYCAVDQTLRELEQAATEELREAERVRLRKARGMLPHPEKSLAFNSDGPLWYRGFAQLEDDEARPVVEELRERWRVRSFVVAHTPQVGEIGVRFDSVFLVDTAMVFGAEVGGRPAALEIADGRFTALYTDARKPLVETGAVEDAMPASESVEPWVGPDGYPLPFRSVDEVADFLRTARVLESEDIPVGITEPKKLLLEKYGIRAHAVFRYHDERERNKQLQGGRRIGDFRDSYRNEVAAYELSRMLGMDNLPPAVLRTIGNRAGSVQLWVENAMSEKKRQEEDLGPPDQLAWRRQLDDMRVFDNLINNFDRNQGNVLISQDWRFWLIDHTRSFGMDTRLPYEDRLLRCSRRLWKAIAELDEESVRERLAAYLDRNEIKAIFKRRQKVIERLNSRMADLGEERVLFSLDDGSGSESVDPLEPQGLEPAVPEQPPPG